MGDMEMGDSDHQLISCYFKRRESKWVLIPNSWTVGVDSVNGE
jgi:hypothetical protein